MLDSKNIIDGKYELLKFIGRGGMSKVYLAMDRRLNKQWAVKVIAKKGKNSRVIIQSALDEANMIKRLDHAALPRIVDIIDNKTEIYIVMDYIEGEPLNKIVDKYGAQPQDAVIEWAKQLCDVLNYLHTRKKPIIYRDMKPGNIMLKPDGNIKLIDFGIAREYKEENDSDTTCLGTKGYAAPEQFGGKGQTDARTDVYCLGVTLYHLITGHNPTEPPYELCPIREWNDELSGGLEKIILKATQQNPDDRYQTCAEMLYDLEHYEEMDGAYYIAQRRKLNKFIAVFVSFIIFLCVGIGSKVAANSLNKENYDKYVKDGQKETSKEAKLEDFEKAIQIDGTNTKAYLEMIKVFKEDAVFSVEEEKRLKKNLAIDNNSEELEKREDYSNLAFEIGKLYWYHYNYGKKDGEQSNDIVRKKSSIKWFEDVKGHSNDKESEQYVMSSVYASVGKFNETITTSVTEGTEKGMYAKYWVDINKLLEIAKKDNNEVVQLEIYKTITSAIINYPRKLKDDGIKKEDIINSFEIVKNGVDDIPIHGEDIIKDMHDDVKKELVLAQDEINKVYVDTDKNKNNKKELIKDEKSKVDADVDKNKINKKELTKDGANKINTNTDKDKEE